MIVIAKARGQSVQEHDIGEDPFTVIVHPQGIKVEVPRAVTITPEDTLKCMREMSQRAWVHISTGPLFRHLYGKLFPGETPPDTIEEVLELDEGVLHGAGMIVLGCEACFVGKTKIFFKAVETYLHPKTQQLVGGMLKDMQNLLGGSGGVVIKTQEAPRDNPEEEGPAQTTEETPPGSVRPDPGPGPAEQAARPPERERDRVDPKPA